MKSLNLRSDYYALFKTDRKTKTGIFVLEVEKPNGNQSQQIDSDYIKLFKEMQFILNNLVEKNAQNPAPYGILVDDMFVRFDLSLSSNIGNRIR